MEILSKIPLTPYLNDKSKLIKHQHRQINPKDARQTLGQKHSIINKAARSHIPTHKPLISDRSGRGDR
jgi:hypothetical protein